MEALEQRLGYKFHDPALLSQALTHSSYANENKQNGAASNERLEFLGDSILGKITAEYLFRAYPLKPEGELTRTRSSLVCEQSLAAVASALGLGEFLRLGKGEIAGGGRDRHSINADAVEAVLAAIYLDGGESSARAFVHRFILSRIASLEKRSRDYKTILQEVVQREREQHLSYRLLSESGPDHSKLFTVGVFLNSEQIGLGAGHNKKEAEQLAAASALTEHFGEE